MDPFLQTAIAGQTLPNELEDSPTHINVTGVSSRTESPTDITDVDEITNPKPIITKKSSDRPNSLLSLLSGKQKTKKRKVVKKSEVEDVGSIPTLSQPSEDLTEGESFDSSFTEIQSNDLRKEYDVIELEKRIYSDRKSRAVSAKDFLGKRAKPVESTSISIEESDTVIEIESEEEIVIETDDKSKSIEDKIYGVRDVKRTSAKDLLGSYKKNKVLPKQPSEIVLEANSTSKKNGSQNRNFNVTLKVSPDRLREVEKALNNPFFTKGSTTGNSSKSNASSVFKTMMSHSHMNTPKLTPLQKLKELYPKDLTREQFHVIPTEPSPEIDENYTFPLQRKPKLNIPVEGLLNGTNFFQHLPLNRDVSQNIYAITNQKVTEDTPKSYENKALQRIYDEFVVNVEEEEEEIREIATDSQLWTEIFKPIKTDQLLIEKSAINHIKNWINNSFERLKAQALSTPRNELIKKRKQQQQQKLSSSLLDGFIVDEFEDEGDTESDQEVFVPVLIINGSTGTGKSASVYAAMEEIHGYVHEVNSGQARSRRDLFSTLKELCTTQLVHQKGDKNEFQKGIILFEDTDVLFEQDKTFWTVVQDMINISRRPIVITCTDISTIPKNIVDFASEENAIVNIDLEVTLCTRNEMVDYLKLCCQSKGFHLDRDVIESVVDQCASKTTFDLRKSLMSLQILCQGRCTKNHISFNTDIEAASPQHTDDINELSKKLDILSISDLISNNTHSLIKTHEQHNELLDLYIIDESLLLKQATLPYELDIGKNLNKTLNLPQKEILHKQTFNGVRRAITDYTGSRSKKLSKFILEATNSFQRRSTRSSANSESSSQNELEWQPDTTGTPDSSICHYLSPTPYLLELAPICRNWARFQVSLDKAEIDTYNKHKVSVKKFLEWRQFQGNHNDVTNTFN
ncbi:hypothetical protein CAAN1_07S03862 [[Candida] anglica]|uniref:ATPase AAA-type core domain-containing protein n=1 Tax=[Candida] anglica TaxID=148631 RepID=A0ABP0ECJ8_9ASCO